MFLMNTESTAYKYILLVFILIISTLIRLPILLEPWGGDQAGFGHVAQGILDGKAPYKDMYSLTGYGVFFTFALFFKLFGTTMQSAHIGHLLVSLLTVALVFRFSDHLYGRKAAIIAALCYTIFSNGLAFSGFGYENKSAWGTYWYLSQREVFMAPLIMGAIFLAVIHNKTRALWAYFAIGALVGLAAFYKITAILILVLLIFFLGWEHLFTKTNRSYKALFGRVIFLLLGFILIQLPFLYYFWINDALDDMYQALFYHVPLYASLSRGLRIETLFSGHYSVVSENLVLWLFACISCFHIVFRDRSRNNTLVALWSIGSLVMVWGQGKFFGYHFVLLVPPFAVLTGYGLPKFLGTGSGLKESLADNLTDIRKTFMLTTIVLSVLALAISNYDYYRKHVTYFLGKISEQEYYDIFSEFPTHPYSFRSDYQIVQYLRENGNSGDRLGVIFSAGDTVIHFLTGMKPATRFIQSWYLFSSDERLSKNEITINLRKEFVDQLISAAPRFVLCVHIPFQELIELPCLKEDPSVKKLDEFVHANYRHEKSFPDNRFLFKKI